MKLQEVSKVTASAGAFSAILKTLGYAQKQMPIELSPGTFYSLVMNMK